MLTIISPASRPALLSSRPCRITATMDPLSLLWSLPAVLVFLAALVDGRPPTAQRAVAERRNNNDTVFNPSASEWGDDNEICESFKIKYMYQRKDWCVHSNMLSYTKKFNTSFRIPPGH